MQITDTYFEIHLKPKSVDETEIVFANVDSSGFAKPDTCRPTNGRTFYELEWHDQVEYKNEIRDTIAVKILSQNGKRRS